MKKNNKINILLSVILSLSTATAFSWSVQEDTSIERIDLQELKSEWKKDQTYSIDFLPWNIDELEKRIDRTDPRSVAAYFCASYLRYTDNKKDGLDMLKAVSARGPAFDENLEAGVQTAISSFELNNFDHEREERYWTGRILFQGGNAQNGWKPSKPYTVRLNYLAGNTEAVNKQYEGRDIMSIHYNIIRATQADKGKGVAASIVLTRRKSNPNWYVTQANGVTNNPSGIRGSNWKNVPNDDTPESSHAGYPK
ncbi:MAG: hypothetical protein IKI22_04795 [Neisseriaceae bacterium]|nr:hypothetical protein [Neisseriaceae bacterium]